MPRQEIGDSENDDDYDLGRMKGNDRLEPHRGLPILVMGMIGFVLPLGGILLLYVPGLWFLGVLVLGLVMFVPLGAIAWAMGSIDLGKIRSGRMDPQGEGMTKAGCFLGMIITSLIVLAIVFSFIRYVVLPRFG